jgi:phosphate transport system substrate-binding protein
MMAARRSGPVYQSIWRRFAASYRTAVLRIGIGLIGAVAPLLPATAETIEIQGSTTFSRRILEPNQRAIEEAAGHQLNVVPNKTINGLLAVLEGRADLAMISAPLEREVAILQSRKPHLPFDRLQLSTIAKTRIAFATNPSNPVRTVTLDAIRRTLRGEVTNWRDLGGPDRPIRVVAVRDGGGVTVAVQAELLEGHPISAPDAISVESPKQVIKIVQQLPEALGITQLALIKEAQLPELATDGEVTQMLGLVSLGEPNASGLAVIKATREIAAEKLD